MADPLEDYLSSKGVNPLEVYLQAKEPQRSKKSASRGSFLGPGSVDPDQAPTTLETHSNVPERLGFAASKAIPGINSTIDRATFGAYKGALGAAGRLSEATGTPDSIAARSARDIDQFRQDYPTLASTTDAPGYILGAPGRAALAIGEALPRALGPLQRAAVTSGASGGLTAAAEATTGGGSARDVLDAAEEGAGVGTVAGTGLGLLGAAARGPANAVINSRGGKARQFLEGKGVEVGPGTPGRGGPMDRMYAPPEEIPTNDAAIGRQAEESARAGLNRLNTEDRAVKGAIGRGMNRIDTSGEGSNLRDVTDVMARMHQAADAVGIDPGVRAALRDEIATITRNQGQGFNPETDNYFLSERDLNQLKRGLDRYAGAGQTTAEKFNPLRQAASRVRDMVNEGPYREPNAEYSAQSRRNQLDRRHLGIPERPRGVNGLQDEEGFLSSGESRTAEDAVKNRIVRRGQNTVTAGGQQRAADRFAARHPEVEGEFSKPEILRKRADLDFKVTPRHGGFIERAGESLAPPILAYEMMAHPLRTAAAMTAGNISPLMGRYLYGPARAAQSALPLFLEDLPQLQAPLFTAARNAQERR